MWIEFLGGIATVVLLAGGPAEAQRQQSIQIDAVRERAREPYQAGMAHLRAEAFDAAARAFQQAVDLDPTFDMAYYMLGRTHLATKSYASAIVALTKCRDLHLADASRQSLSRQEIQQQRRRRADEMSERISELQIALRTASPASAPLIQNEIRLVEERKRQVEDAERQITPERAVPAFVSLSLGSAYHRAGRLPEAEQAYRAAIAADPKTGEAHNNLAVVYMQTGQLDEAEQAVRAAERSGLRVSQALKDEIRKRKKGGTMPR
jgi:tetratricopeptide (TPR) repeat protein